MKTLIRITGWGVTLAALTLLFSVLRPPEADALADSRTAVRLLTDGGVRELTMADYLPYAVAAEMPASFGPEALKAQAVAARTYVFRGGRHQDADVCADSGCCLAFLSEEELRALWGEDFDRNMGAVAEAVRATDGQILTYRGEAIQAVFHASSAGSTEDSGNLWQPLPYLVSVSTPETSESVPGLYSEKSFAPDELRSLLGISPEESPEAWLGPAEPDSAGRVGSLTLGGVTFSGRELRSLLGLRSTAFAVRYENGRFVFTAAGYGHGVGMSQYGARLLADQGMTYDQILAHYYPGTELTACTRSTVIRPSRSAARAVSPGDSSPRSSISASRSSI